MSSYLSSDGHVLLLYISIKWKMNFGLYLLFAALPPSFSSDTFAHVSRPLWTPLTVLFVMEFIMLLICVLYVLFFFLRICATCIYHMWGFMRVSSSIQELNLLSMLQIFGLSVSIFLGSENERRHTHETNYGLLSKRYNVDEILFVYITSMKYGSTYSRNGCLYIHSELRKM